MINTKESDYCKDLSKVENYEKALNSPEKWDVHHRLETHFSDGTLRPLNARLSYKELIALKMYYNRPPEELIFMKHSEHMKLHLTGRKHPENVKRKMSEARKGRPGVCRGRHWFTNGIINIRALECPEGFKPGKVQSKWYINKGSLPENFLENN